MIADYVEARIRRDTPPDSAVVPRSTPVIAFGDPNTSRVATLGLNPSWAEFLSPAGKLLAADRRFETLDSLGVESLSDAPDSLVARVLEGCQQYFVRNPYRRWFDQLETVLTGIDASYYAGNACHLDLVQWATYPIWRQLSPLACARLLANDVPFLRRQLSGSQIRLVLLNGRRVVEECQQAFNVRFTLHGQPVSDGRLSSSLYRGVLAGGIQVIGWSMNLQSSHGVTNVLRTRLRQRVADLAAGG